MKAKRGSKVKHTKSGKEGVVLSVVRGTARVLFKDGSKGIFYTGSLSKGSGCAFLMMVPLMVLLGGLIVVYSWTT